MKDFAANYFLEEQSLMTWNNGGTHVICDVIVIFVAKASLKLVYNFNQFCVYITGKQDMIRA